MGLAMLLLLLVLTFSSSVMLAERFARLAKATVAGIVVLIFWLCALVVPVQCLALLNLAGLSSSPRLSHLFLLDAAVFVCALVLYLLGPRRQQPTQGSTVGLRWSVPLHIRLGLLFVLCVYGVLCVRMAVTFPDGWDAVAYHYPIALRWLQDGTMRISNTTPWQASLPGNVEILDLLVLWTGRQRLLGSVQWPGLLILLFACLYLSHRLGKSAAWPVATTTLMIPIVANQSVSGDVDLFGTAVLFGSLSLVLEYCDQLKNRSSTPRPALLVAAGLGCGLAVGAKPVFWIFAALLFLNALFLLLRSVSNSNHSAWGGTALFLASAAIPSVFWFVRATACTGNPFYPFALHIGSLSLPGVRPSDITIPQYYLANVRGWAELFVYPWTEWKRANGFLLVNYTLDSGLGGGFATFVVPGVLIAFWLARKRPDLRIWLFNLALLAIVWFLLLEKVIRFGLPLFVLAAVLSTPFFEVLESRRTRSCRVIYVLVFFLTACILVFEPLYTIFQTVRYGYWSRAAYMQYPTAIDTLPPGSTVLSLCSPTSNFALAGNKLSNRVIPDWERPKRLTADFLQSHQVDYIAENSVQGTGGVTVDAPPPTEGLSLYFGATIQEGTRVVDWRIWSTGRLRNLPARFANGAKRIAP